MDISIGASIGPWIIISIINKEKDRLIAVVKQIGDVDEYVMKISESNKEYMRIPKYNLSQYGVKLYKNESEAYGKYGSYYWFVMEKYTANCSIGNTFGLDICKFIEDVIKFLKYLHREHRVIHGDIKLPNILYKEGTYSVADYELIKEPDNDNICDESDFDNYYFYSYGAKYGMPVFSYRYDLQAVGYMLMVIDNNYKLLPFQKKAHYYYRHRVFDNYFDELNALKNEYELPEKIKAYFKLIRRVDWFSLEPPTEDIYDEIITLFR